MLNAGYGVEHGEIFDMVRDEGITGLAIDGGPLTYRVIHRVRLWRAGERPQLRQEIAEGDASLAT